MATTTDLLTDAFERVREAATAAVDGLTAHQLAFRPGGTGNSIGWLVWHLARVQDDHVADAAGTTQAWLDDGWRERFVLPFEPEATGYGQSSDEVAQVQGLDGALLTGYLEAVHARTVAYLATLGDADLDRVVDDSWDPPVTLAVRLVSVVADDLQHAGQAAYVRGLLD